MRLRRVLVSSLWFVAMALSAVAIGLLSVNQSHDLGDFTPHAIMGPGYATVGALILMRRSHRIGTMFLGFALLVAVTGSLFEFCTWADPDGHIGVCSHESPLGPALWPAGFLFFGALLLLFPTGNLPSRRWLPVAAILFASYTVITVLPLFGLTELLDDELGPLVALAVWALAASATAPLFRVRKAGAIERQQLRYLGYVVAVSLVAIAIGLGLELTGRDEALLVVNVLIVGNVAFGIPVAVGIAILRYRLYDIDLIINRTLVYGGLTAILAGIYVGLVFGLQAILAPLTAKSDLAIAASTLAVAALFRPLRSRVQAFIDRRFYRRKFDSQRTLEDFSSHVRDDVELRSLSDELVTVVRDTVQPAHVSLWLRPRSAGSGGEDA